MTSGRTWSSALFVVLLVACGGSSTKKSDAPSTTTLPPPVVVTSTAFSDNGAIPRANACDGGGAIPPLAWRGVTPNANTVAIVVDDPDAPSGDFVHWLVTGLPAGDGDASNLPSSAVQHPNSAGVAGWSPPCPPAGKAHHYRFTVYALGSDPVVNGKPAAAIAQIEQAAIARGTLTGTYHR